VVGVPASWRISLCGWEVRQNTALSSIMLNLSTMSGLFNPEAFITATKQCVGLVVKADSWSLEQLHFDVWVAEKEDKHSFDDCSVDMEGLKVSGAVCRNNQLVIASKISTILPLNKLRGIKKTDCKYKS
jgi:hypothetical protein